MSTEAAVDGNNPWLGLASFTEETRSYFFGRDDEIAELARRVQRKLLTVLFGQSGLGKTSILRAGLVPRLRAQGYCPVYVRIDYGADAPEPAAQIKQAISRTARRAGEWTQAGVAVEGESLWEFLHHRDDVLQDESGNTLVPLLIFDQFEEIFTLAQSDAPGRARAARFIADLADLVENRPPRELEARLDQDESAAERFDFGRSDYRVLIALREDYLAPLEGLKGAMPSISQNRLRLAPMNGSQALSAVLQPGKGLVSEEVAGAIVRFVAGGAEIANAEVEPSLLSLICRELNDARLSQGRREISLDLLDGSQSSILTNFYERALADQPSAVRNIIEDQLLTDSGYRENIAEERLLASLKAAGATPDTLPVLVNRRLLRIEERLDIRRVELTHDVLCAVVKASRDLRKEREARDATQRVIAEQQQREAGAKKALIRARQIAGACAVLALLAVVAAVFAVMSTQRARRAEANAQETKSVAEQARGQAQTLLTYLTDDFARELQDYGRLDTVQEIATRQVDYFTALPPSLKDRDTIRNGASAMISLARAARQLGDVEKAAAMSTDALRLIEQLRSGGDNSQATTIAMARALQVQAGVLSNKADPAALPAIKRARELLRPVATAAGASEASRRAYGDILVSLGFEQSHEPKEFAEAEATLAEAQQLAAAMGGHDLKNLDAAMLYADAGGWRTEALQRIDRNAEARSVGLDSVAISDKILELRPGHRRALHTSQLIYSDLGGLAFDDLRVDEAIAAGSKSLGVSSIEIKLDPDNKITLNNISVTYLLLGDFAWAAGRLQESVDYYNLALQAVSKAAQAGAWFVLNALYPAGQLAVHEADAGMDAEARKTFLESTKQVDQLRASEPADSKAPLFSDCYSKYVSALVAMTYGDARTAVRDARESKQMVRDVKPDIGFENLFKWQCTAGAGALEGQADYVLGDFAAAEQALKTAIEDRKQYGNSNNGDHREVTGMGRWLALAVVRQGRGVEAEKLLAPALQLQRGLATHNHGEHLQKIELAETLYVQAMYDRVKRPALLREAAGLIDKAPAGLRSLRSTQLWRKWIAEAERTPG